MAAEQYKDHALSLFDMGYKPIPIWPGKKYPMMSKGEN